ncbi:hypothetical protein SAMN05444920_11340 [Nonomuraea solani]|uniref:Excreted virulence factor EspC, type VII ESX diderm n=1 Tax=Nonomuraea solani TaxID=1144553 RepID=A0A1H6ER63_9ACTN|nr:hypothetical protein [Nonomuraea solani]SEG99435.1 hypothetical protein SAMN05444920_11340 [Nonomuraea solani]
MGDDRGVELSRKAIKAARIDLEEALGMLDPNAEGAKQGGGAVKAIFTESGPATQLGSDYDAMGGFWPAAMGFRQSTTNAITTVTGSYANITGQVANVIGLLKQAMQNYDDMEVDGEGRAKQVQV